MAWLAGYAVGVAVVVMVRGSMPTGVGALAKWVAVATGFVIGLTLLHASGLKGVSEARYLNTAEPLPSDAQVRRGSPWNPASALLFVTPCVTTILWQDGSPYLLLLPTDSLARAVAGVWWERRHGRLVWRGCYHRKPWKLTYSPVSPPPPTRTATDAPPA